MKATRRFRSGTVLASGLVLATLLGAPAMAQKSYDDHELTDRFYITIGGYRQDDIRTTFRLDAKTSVGIGLGTAGSILGETWAYKNRSRIKVGLLVLVSSRK